jgi:hypothetical protein
MSVGIFTERGTDLLSDQSYHGGGAMMRLMFYGISRAILSVSGKMSRFLKNDFFFH